MRLFIETPQQLINYNNDQPELEALVKLGDATNVVGLGLKLDKKPDEARPYFEAAFALGKNLYDERICWRELASGLSLMSESAQNLAKLADEAGDGARVDAIRHFIDALVQYEQKLQEQVASPLANPVEQTYGGKYAGDVFDIAANPNAGRVWRVEAILHLGRYRYNVADGHRGDQLAVEGRLRQLEEQTGPDLVLHTAIHVAQHLTSEQQQMTR
jgi:tetratricopeptide (TPR) repeat protein